MKNASDSVKLNCFLYGLFIFAPIADALTGFLIFNRVIVEGGLISPSQFLRFFLFFFSFFLLKKHQIHIAALVFIFFFIVESISFVRHGQIYVVIWGQLYIIKIIAICTFFFVLYNERNDFKPIFSLFIQSALLYAAILLVSSGLGINASTHTSGTFGTKGLFASGNGLGFYLGSALCLYGYINRKYRIFTGGIFFHQLILFVATFLIATKTGFIFIVVFLFFKFFRSTFVVRSLVAVPAIVVAILFLPKITAALSTVYEVVLFRLERSDNILSFIASGREVYVADAFKDYFQTDYGIRFFSGGGSILSFQKPDNFTYDTLETDLFDVFFMYGIFFMTGYCLIILYFFCKSLKCKNYCLFVLFATASFHSIAAGHVIFNAMSAVIVIVLMLLILDKNSTRVQNNMFSSLQRL
jgi:hypothetical protein